MSKWSKRRRLDPKIDNRGTSVVREGYYGEWYVKERSYRGATPRHKIQGRR